MRQVQSGAALQQAGLPAYHDLIAACSWLEVLEEARAVGFVEGEGLAPGSDIAQVTAGVDGAVALDGAVPQREVHKFQSVAAPYSGPCRHTQQACQLCSTVADCEALSTGAAPPHLLAARCTVAGAMAHGIAPWTNPGDPVIMLRPQQYSDHTSLPTATWLRLPCMSLCASSVSKRWPLHSKQDKIHANSWLTKLVLGTAAPCQQKHQDQHQCAAW